MCTLKIGTFNQCILISPSDIVVQIVDARNPLLFRCEDLVKQCFVLFSFLLFLQLHIFHNFAVQLLLLNIFSCGVIWSISCSPF